LVGKKTAETYNAILTRKPVIREPVGIDSEVAYVRVEATGPENILSAEQ
jgi:hypothetical protein